MQISTLTKISAMFFVVLSVFLLALTYSFNISVTKERYYAQRQLELNQLSHRLGQVSDYLTREARRYTIFGDKRHFDAYWKEVKETRTRDSIVERLQKMQVTAEELALMEKAKANSDALIKLEDEAMRKVLVGDLEAARHLMFGEEYDKQKKIIMDPIEEFQTAINERAKKEAAAAKSRASHLLMAANVTIVSYVMFVLLFLYWTFFWKISRPLEGITQAVTKISTGKIATEIPHLTANDEIGRLAKAAEIFKESLVSNKQLAIDLQEHRDNLEQEVKLRTKDLTMANGELEEFSYRISHDLRSPLISSIKLLSLSRQSMQSDDLKTAHQSLELAEDSLKKLEALLQDILELAETKNKKEEQKSVDVVEIIDESIKKMSYMDNFERLNFYKELKFTPKLLVKKSRFVLIIENLISNAIKYQNLEEEHSYIKVLSRKDGNNFVLEVEDNGIGIPKEQEHKLFSMFQRFHPRTAFGSGLGLYMIKKSANILGADITYHNNGVGATFRLTLPLIQGE